MGRFETSEGRIPRGGDAELHLNCSMRFCQSRKRVRAEQRHGGEKPPAVLGATRGGSVCFSIEVKAGVVG